MAPKTGKKKRKAAEAAEAEERAEAAAPVAAGGKKKRGAAEQAAGLAEPAAAAPAPAAEAAPPETTEEVAERREDAFSAAAVVFHTRGKDGKVSKVLVAVEERKVQASYIGLAQTGKVTQSMVLFPMGRREKKDKADSVETAKREYVEETGDFGGLAKYLDFADFDGGSDAADPRGPEAWTGRQNMAVFFAPARMIVLFCEVPEAAALDSSRAASGGVPLAAAGGAAVAPAAAAEAEAALTKKKRRKAQEAQAQINQNGTRATYKVGRTDHLEPTWLDAAALRGAVTSGERSPTMSVLGQECRLFPTAASVLRLPEVRDWLGMSSEAGAA